MGISGRSWSLAFVVVSLFFQTCNANTKDDSPKCTSSCGNIHNISYPFRLKHDLKHCSSRFTLLCENNITILDQSAFGRFYVQAINYENQTIRVVDPGLFQNNNCSSIPQNRSPFLSGRAMYSYDLFSTPIFFLRCNNPVNSSMYVDTASCINTSAGTASSLASPDSPPNTYGYVKVGNMDLGDLNEGCSTEWMASAMLNSFNLYNSSYKYIHNALVYGFELHYTISEACEQWSTNAKCFPRSIKGFFQLVWELIRKFFAPGYTIYVGYKWLPSNSTDVRWALLFNVGLLFLAKFILGTPFVTLLLIKKWRTRHLSSYRTIEDFLHNGSNFVPIRYSFSEIKKMSNNFKNKLGEGGYGSVFKGVLRSSRFGAIKMMANSKSNGQDFVSEVATIGRIHHVNVVQLIGYCVEGSKRALVYDFMSNGSLDKYIFSNAETIPLSVKKMYEISLGVAQGIEYLHQGCEMQILHFDIKPHNILLDENFIPKVSDFGLAKLYSTDDSIVTLTAARGTMGYIAPELFYKNIGGVSYKADVYSFGMLLMEMASKRKNFKELAGHESQTYFPSWVYDQYEKGRDLEMGDATDEEKKIIKRMVVTALWCIQMNPSHRPSMRKVREMLEGDVELLQMPPNPFTCSEEIPLADVQNNIDPTCSNTQLTCTLSAR
ncbi:rust resistance kinase Lr10-like [Rosa sericea]